MGKIFKLPKDTTYALVESATKLGEVIDQRDIYFKENQKLRAELAQYKQDAERYQWLKRRAYMEDHDGGYVKYYVLPLICYKRDYEYKGRKPFYHKTLDEAIDNAMKEVK